MSRTTRPGEMMGETKGKQRGLRALAAAAVTVVSFGVLALFGGLGGVVAPTPASAQYEYGKKVTICHMTGSEKNPFVTITVSENALDAHLAHGDTIGPCPD